MIVDELLPGTLQETLFRDWSSTALAARVPVGSLGSPSRGIGPTTFAKYSPSSAAS